MTVPASQRFRNAASESLAAAEDEGGFAFKIEIHVLPPPGDDPVPSLTPRSGERMSSETVTGYSA